MAAQVNAEAKALCLAVLPILESMLAYYENSSSEDEDKEFMVVLAAATTRQKIPRIRNYLTKTVARYNEDQFMEDFRVGKRVASDHILMFNNSPFYSAHAPQGGGHIPVSAE